MSAAEVREIMGWRQDWANGSDTWKSWFRPGATSPVGLHDSVTVDDMIAWLRSTATAITEHGYRFRDVSVWRCTTDQPQEACSVTTVLDERYDVHFHGATLHEALTKAVLAIGAASSVKSGEQT